jgi:hypothetical protein
MNRRSKITVMQYAIIIIATILAIGCITDWLIFNVYIDEPIMLVAKIILAAGIYLVATAIAIAIKGVSKEALYERIRHHDMNTDSLYQYDSILVDHLPEEGESCTFYLLATTDLAIHVFLYIKEDETDDNLDSSYMWVEVGVLDSKLPWTTYKKTTKPENIDRFKYHVDKQV